MTLVKIAHAQFTYQVETGTKRHKRTGEDIPQLSTRHAHRGQVIDIPLVEDYERGEKLGAFEEVTEREADTAEETEPEVVPADEPITTETHDELVRWIRDEKPPASAVVRAADGDPDKARRLMAAEEEASGSQPRKTVMDPLRRIAGE